MRKNTWLSDIFLSSIYMDKNIVDDALEGELEVIMEGIIFVCCPTSTVISPGYVYRAEDLTRDLLYKIYEKAGKTNFIDSLRKLKFDIKKIEVALKDYDIDQLQEEIKVQYKLYQKYKKSYSDMFDTINQLVPELVLLAELDDKI